MYECHEFNCVILERAMQLIVLEFETNKKYLCLKYKTIHVNYI